MKCDLIIFRLNKNYIFILNTDICIINVILVILLCYDIYNLLLINC